MSRQVVGRDRQRSFVSPRRRRASLMSLGWIVTRLAWIAGTSERAEQRRRTAEVAVLRMSARGERCGGPCLEARPVSNYRAAAARTGAQGSPRGSGRLGEGRRTFAGLLQRHQRRRLKAHAGHMVCVTSEHAQCEHAPSAISRTRRWKGSLRICADQDETEQGRHARACPSSSDSAGSREAQESRLAG